MTRDGTDACARSVCRHPEGEHANLPPHECRLGGVAFFCACRAFIPQEASHA